MMATRLYTPERFSMTAGVNVPFDLALIEDLYDALPRRLGEARLTDLMDEIGVLPRPSIESPSPTASWIVSPTRTRPKTLPNRSGQIGGHAACTRRVSAAQLAPTLGEVDKQFQSDTRGALCDPHLGRRHDAAGVIVNTRSCWRSS